jgi:hypothetical protein
LPSGFTKKAAVLWSSGARSPSRVTGPTVFVATS